MDKATGFIKYPREGIPLRPVKNRLKDWDEVYYRSPEDKIRRQSARCMDCGTPFCHQGCPLGNLIPKWNELVYQNRWKEASDVLHTTNNFPEFTGLLCPSPCESSCVLAINSNAVTNKQTELAIVEKAWDEGWIVPQKPLRLTGKKVAIIGSGPAGLACAQQLRRAGHHIIVFERLDRIGGLLRYGIPNFKMNKLLLDRRLKQLIDEGILFKTSIDVGVDIDARKLLKSSDAIVLACGAAIPRDIDIPGRKLQGIHYAMEYLALANRKLVGDDIDEKQIISAKGKNVIIIGGGDTGADCLGTALRQGCKRVLQLELLPRLPDKPAPDNPWPQWQYIYRMSSSHEEGGKQLFLVNTKEFLGDKKGNIKSLVTSKVKFVSKNNNTTIEEIPNSKKTYHADLVLLALGFIGPEKTTMLTQLGIELTKYGTIKADEHNMTNIPGVFTAGDMNRGQSLIVWAIAEGRHVAHEVDHFLMGKSELPDPFKNGHDKVPFR